MVTEIVAIRVGQKDDRDNVYSSEAIKAIARADPDKYRIDEEGNLRQMVSDTKTDELEKLLRGTPAESAIEYEAALKFQQVLKAREAKGLPTCRPGNKDGSGKGWISITINFTGAEYEDEEL